MSGIRISIYRVILITQGLLLMSLTLPGLLGSLDPEDTQHQTTTQPNPSELLLQTEKIQNPAALIDYLEFYFHSHDHFVELRGPDNTLYFKRYPLKLQPSVREGWIQSLLSRFGMPQRSTPDIVYTQDALSGWSLRLTAPQDRQSAASLPEITIDVRTLLASLFIVVMLSILGSRLLTRPLQEVERQLQELRNRSRHALSIPRQSPRELSALLQSVDEYVTEQTPILTEAGYTDSLIEQLLENLDVPVLVLDASGSHRFSNHQGRRRFKIGTHPNTSTFIEFANDPVIVDAMVRSTDALDAIPVGKVSGLPKRTMVRAIVRGNAAPWMLFTITPKSEFLKTVRDKDVETESPAEATISGEPKENLLLEFPTADLMRRSKS